MARKFPPSFAFNFAFDGGLQTDVRGRMVCELLKYFLYERQQIPLPFENVKEEIDQVRQRQTQDGPQSVRRRIYNNLELKKATNAVKNIEDISSHIKLAFEVCPEVKQVLILFGGTVVSPKEMYLINMPQLNPEAENIDPKSSVKSLFRQLIMQDLVGKNIKSLSATNMYILLNAPRNCGINWFLPKPSYKLPQRGRNFCINLTCHHDCIESASNLSRDMEEVEISGIEPLDLSAMDFTMGDSSQNASIESTKTLPSMNSNLLGMGSKGDNCNFNASCLTWSEEEAMQQSADLDEGIFSMSDQEYIWFQTPICVQGYKDKSSKPATSDMLL